MSWSVGYDSNWKRDIGYGVPSICDHPDCNECIDRGLPYVCGGEPYGGDRGCGLYFCGKHLSYYKNGVQVCDQCGNNSNPFEPKPDLEEWIQHKMTDPSWDDWRKSQEGAIA
jgi:hypothetical protein